MLEYSKSILYSLILLFLLANPSKTTAQRVGFNTQLNFSATALENFISTIAINQNQVYFIANIKYEFKFNWTPLNKNLFQAILKNFRIMLKIIKLILAFTEINTIFFITLSTENCSCCDSMLLYLLIPLTNIIRIYMRK